MPGEFANTMAGISSVVLIGLGLCLLGLVCLISYLLIRDRLEYESRIREAKERQDAGEKSDQESRDKYRDEYVAAMNKVVYTIEVNKVGQETAFEKLQLFHRDCGEGPISLKADPYHPDYWLLICRRCHYAVNVSIGNSGSTLLCATAYDGNSRDIVGGRGRRDFETGSGVNPIGMIKVEQRKMDSGE